MNLLIEENGQVIRYTVKYDKARMSEFLNSIINNYGYFRNMELKLSSEAKITSYCNEYRDLRVVKTSENNSKIHQGRKRIPRKTPLLTYVFNFTAVDYPEIFWTITKFLKQQDMDFSIFFKYINANVIDYNNFNYYIEEEFMKYNASAINTLRSAANDSQLRKQHIDGVISRRLHQRECLNEFLSLFTFELIKDEIVVNNDLFPFELSHSYMNMFSSFPNALGYAEILGQFMGGNRQPLPKPSEIKLSQHNAVIINEIQKYDSIKGMQKTKSR